MKKFNDEAIIVIPVIIVALMITAVAVSVGLGCWCYFNRKRRSREQASLTGNGRVIVLSGDLQHPSNKGRLVVNVSLLDSEKVINFAVYNGSYNHLVLILSNLVVS